MVETLAVAEIPNEVTEADINQVNSVLTPTSPSHSFSRKRVK